MESERFEAEPFRPDYKFSINKLAKQEPYTTDAYTRFLISEKWPLFQITNT